MPGSPAPTTPSSSNSFINRPAHGYPIRNRRWSNEIESVFCDRVRFTAWSNIESLFQLDDEKPHGHVRHRLLRQLHVEDTHAIVAHVNYVDVARSVYRDADGTGEQSLAVAPRTPGPQETAIGIKYLHPVVTPIGHIDAV